MKRKKIRKVTELYDAILKVLTEDTTSGMNAWNVTKQLRAALKRENLNNKTVQLYLADLVKQKQVKETIAGNHSYYSINRR